MIRSRYMRLFLLLIVIFSILTLTGLSNHLSIHAAGTPVPLVTLVPPTVVPPPPPPTATPTITKSAIARIRDADVLNVGITYNAPRFSEITDTGDIEGFEADIARAIGEDWGAQVNFIQVTRQNSLDMLLSGKVDLLMGQQILSRDMESLVDFSDPIFASKEVALVLSSSPAKDIKDLAGQTVGVVAGSRGEDAFTQWMTANNIQATVKRYAMLDNGLGALLNGEVAALVGDRWELDQRVNGAIQGVSLLNGAFRIEPYAIAMQRYDDNLRTLVNRTLQRLKDRKRLDPLFDHWFPSDLPAAERISPYVWLNLSGDTRAIDNFPADIVRPAQSVIDRIKSGQPLRVAGLGAPLDTDGKPPILEGFNQALVNEMARRWGVPVQAIPDSYGKGEDMLASGQADLAVGIEPQWGSVDRIDIAGVYAQHAYRLVVRYGSNNVNNFANFFSTQHRMGVFADDPLAYDEVKKLAGAYRIAEDSLHKITIQSDADAAQALTTDTPIADAIFGDSLRVLPLIQAYPKFVQLAGNDANQTYPPYRQIAFGVPRNDADFRVLVEVTLQNMYRDGTYQQLWKANFAVIGNPLDMLIWPGQDQLFGVNTK